ncbi:hypothetical protein BaRGS_00016684, partial [Batillaria attramentaria]
ATVDTVELNQHKQLISSGDAGSSEAQGCSQEEKDKGRDLEARSCFGQPVALMSRVMGAPPSEWDIFRSATTKVVT